MRGECEEDITSLLSFSDFHDDDYRNTLGLKSAAVSSVFLFFC